MKPIVPIILFLFVALVGCRKNVVEPLTVTAETFLDDKWVISVFPDRLVVELDAIKPLAGVPVVEYTVKKNAKGDINVVLTVLEKAVGLSKSLVHYAEVAMLDDHRFSVSLPVALSTDHYVHVYLADKSLGTLKKMEPGEQPQENRGTETEEENE